MNAHTLRVLDMLNRIISYFLDYPITPALPRATAAQAEVTTITTALEAAAQDQTTGSGSSEGGVDLREVYARDLRGFLKDVNRTARTLETEHPGIRPIFRLPASGSYPALIASAQSIIAAATEIQASFVAAGMPETFIADLNALLAAFTTATGQKHGGGITRTGATATLKAQASLGVIAATKLDACVRNHFRGNVAAIAAWTHARRIERPARSADTGTTPPPDTGSGSGSETDTGASTTATIG